MGVGSWGRGQGWSNRGGVWGWVGSRVGGLRADVDHVEQGWGLGMGLTSVHDSSRVHVI